MTETTRPSERVGGKRKMTDEDDGDDVEDGREQREEEDGGKEGHGGDGEDADAEGVRETDVVME